MMGECIAAGAFMGLFGFWWVIKTFGPEEDDE